MHLIWNCPFSREIWHETATWTGCSALALRDRLQSSSSIKVCQAIVRKAAAKHKRGIKIMIMMIAWELWKEWNASVFRAKFPSVTDVIAAIRSNMEQWRIAGATDIEAPFGEKIAR